MASARAADADSIGTPLTDGQARVRAIVRAHLPEYHRAVAEAAELARSGDREAEGQTKLYAFDQLRNQLARYPVVRTDPVTGRWLGYYDVADGYVRWLEHHSRKVDPIPTDSVIRLDQFVYTRVSQKACWYAFSGGDKWATTMSVLFAFADGRAVHSRNLDADYYCRSGLLVVGSGGNHRLLAQVLWGGRFVFRDAVNVFEEQALDPDLNTALLTIERGCTGAHLRYPVPLDYASAEQAEEIKQLAASVSASEWRVLADYLRQRRTQRQYSHDGSPAWCRSHVEMLRQLRDRPQFPARRELPARPSRSIWAWWPRRTQRPVASAPVPAFERWYADTLPDADEPTYSHGASTGGEHNRVYEDDYQ